MTAGMTDTIAEGLGRYSIGEKLRSMRLRKSMGLVELGKHTGFRRHFCRSWKGESCFPLCPHYCALRWCSG
jgi:hypothetical protein